jgi:hypothetical protein
MCGIPLYSGMLIKIELPDVPFNDFKILRVLWKLKENITIRNIKFQKLKYLRSLERE